jgi:hypothetical protein
MAQQLQKKNLNVYLLHQFDTKKTIFGLLDFSDSTQYIASNYHLKLGKKIIQT